MLTHDRDEELTLFLEMRRREKENRGSDTISSNGTSSAAAAAAAAAAALLGVTETVSSQRYRRTAAENFLYSENEKSDYDWLLTPPGTPQFDKESHRNTTNQLEAPNSRPTLLKSRLGNCREEITSGNNTKLQTSSSLIGLRRPTSSGSSRSTSRPSTPTRRSAASTTSTATTTKAASTSRSSTPTSRATLTASRASTLTTSHATLTTSRAATSTTSTAPTRTMTRSMTRPSSAPSSPRKKPGSRPATPTRRPSTPTGPPIVSSKTTKPVSSRGTSPITRSKPWKAPEMPGFSLEAPPNLRTSLPDRPVSASRGRPGASAPSSRSSSIERGTGTIGGSKRQSCSPSRGRAGTNVAQGRGKAVNNGDNSDGLSPVAMGNKMVERVVNMRKLGPPRLTESNSGVNGKSNSLGYGRNLSKSSIDMALRHMDIRRGMTGNLRPLVTKVPASSMYSVRAAGSRAGSRPGSRAGSATDSPMATSSSVSSSELSVNILCLDGNEAENDDLLSEKNYFSPRNQNLKFKS